LTAAVVRDDRGRITLQIATVEDVMARKTAEHKLRRTAERLRGVSRRAVDLQETERLQISRELHDEVGQTFDRPQTAAGCGISPGRRRG
jgi:signal transduction histidine kinase